MTPERIAELVAAVTGVSRVHHWSRERLLRLPRPHDPEHGVEDVPPGLPRLRVTSAGVEVSVALTVAATSSAPAVAAVVAETVDHEVGAEHPGTPVRVRVRVVGVDPPEPGPVTEVRPLG